MIDNGIIFAEYWRKVRGRTLRVLDHLPAADLEWSWTTGRFTFGDLFRHLAGIERFMYAETVLGRPSRYPGHGRQLADGPAEIRRYLDQCHTESLAIFSGLTASGLARKCRTPAGAAIATWKWLRAMTEHEAHHRGQLYLMASMRDVTLPPLFGLTEEEVAARSGPAAPCLDPPRP
jgi:uncharacterized damage-inducible protein DinB